MAYENMKIAQIQIQLLAFAEWKDYNNTHSVKVSLHSPWKAFSGIEVM